MPTLEGGGVEAAVDAVVVHLEGAVPTHLDAIEAARGPVVEEVVPRLVAHSDRSRLEPEDYPALLVVPQEERDLRRVDIVDTGAVYEARYRLRIFGFVRGPARHWDATAQAQRRLASAVRLAWITRQDFLPDYRFELAGFRLSYSELAGAGQGRDQRSFGAFYADGIVVATERSSRPTSLAPSTTEVTSELLAGVPPGGAHPALD